MGCQCSRPTASLPTLLEEHPQHKRQGLFTATAAKAPGAQAETQASRTSQKAAGERIKLLLWNVYWENKDTNAMAEIITPNDADVIGLNEFTADWGSLLGALNASAPHRDYQLAKGTGDFRGYGTDIVFDANRFDVLDGGEDTVWCNGTQGGERAANWVVVRDRASQRTIITGGIHLSYCANNSCDTTQECELGRLYDRLEEMKQLHADAAVAWMGDLNHHITDPICDNLLSGYIGSRSVFPVDDVAQTEGRTHYSGGLAIDHILAEGKGFVRIDGGRTGQATDGQWLNGSDHFPVFAELQYAA